MPQAHISRTHIEMHQHTKSFMYFKPDFPNYSSDMYHFMTIIVIIKSGLFCKCVSYKYTHNRAMYNYDCHVVVAVGYA